MVKALIFDFDGLILDTESPLVQAWKDIYESFGVQLPLERWAQMLGQATDPPEAYEHLESELGVKVDRVAIRKKRVAREAELLKDEEPLSGVKALIDEATLRGFRLAIASSSEHAWVDRHLERLNLLSYFNVIICADDVELTKPAPDLYLLAMQELDVGPHEAIALEDSAYGAQAALAAGLACVVIPNAITRLASFEDGLIMLDTLEGVGLDDLILMVR